MSYQITEEEKNKVKLNSPFALPTSPTERGMKPEAIKAMFWKPFEILIELINTRFGKMTDSEGVQRLISELQSSINEALNNKQNRLVIGENLDKMPTEYSENLVTSGGTYSAILELRNIIRDINVPNIYYVGTFGEAIRAVNTGINIKPNDIIIITTMGAPDLVVFHVGSQAADGALLITQAQIEAGAVPTPKAGDRFTIENAGLGVICLEGGIVEPKITVEKELCDSENPIAAFVVDEIIQTIVERVDTAESIAKKANQAVSFPAYAEMIYELNSLPNNVFDIGQNIYIERLNVPDLWVSDIRKYSVDLDYTTPEEYIVNILKPKEEGGQENIQVGYYVLSALESQKVDLTKYVKFEDLDTLPSGDGDGCRDVTIADITLEEDVVSIDITRDDFADVDKVTDLIITFEIAIPNPISSNTATNPLYVKFNGITAAVIGKQVSGWAHEKYVLNGTLVSLNIGTSRMCIAPTALGANNTINYALGTVKNLLPATLNSIEIVPANPSELPIPAGSKIKIEGRVTK